MLREQDTDEEEQRRVRFGHPGRRTDTGSVFASSIWRTERFKYMEMDLFVLLPAHYWTLLLLPDKTV